MLWVRLTILVAALLVDLGNAFSTQHRPRGSFVFSLKSGSTTEEVVDEAAVQWDLFKKHHAKGSWKGVWTSYNYIGDVIDETIGSVDLVHDETVDAIQHSHKIVTGATRADCQTCFDSFEVRTIPVATYRPDRLLRTRLGAVGMVNGPTLLRSGSMATELVLSHGDGRVRVMFQHAPVWQAGVEPGSGPPQGLKLFRTMVSREALRDAPPTAETEQNNNNNTTVFFRPVPPFAWHKEWAGTSWTWGPSTGNRGWSITKMEEADAWHGRPTGDTDNVWNLRLPGGILLQGPRVVVSGEASLCRLAWLPNDETLLRLEVSVSALEPMLVDDDTVVGFHPPSLGSLRCDVLTKIGELEDASRLVASGEQDVLMPIGDEELQANQGDEPDDQESGLEAVRRAMQP